MSNPIKLRKAVVPVAGLGTRFLPATKAIPKEMLPVVDKPLIQLVVEEAREAGIEQFIFVTGRNKSVIEDHFDRHHELEILLAARGKTEELEILSRDIPETGTISFTRQQDPLGLGHAIWCARHLVGHEPFAVLLPDVIMKSKPGCLQQLVEVFGSHPQANLLAIEREAEENLSRYGVVSIGEWSGNSCPISGIVEKPSPGTAPSNLIVSGRYVLQPQIFAQLESQQPGINGEIHLTDAMLGLMTTQSFIGVLHQGKTFDCGDKIGFLLANAAYGLADERFGHILRRELVALLSQS